MNNFLLLQSSITSNSSLWYHNIAELCLANYELMQSGMYQSV